MTGFGRLLIAALAFGVMSCGRVHRQPEPDAPLKQVHFYGNLRDEVQLCVEVNDRMRLDYPGIRSGMLCGFTLGSLRDVLAQLRKAD